MKNLTAIVKLDGATTHKTYNDYKTKKEFKNELRMNGYTVIAILTDKEIESRRITADKYTPSNIDEYVCQCL